MAALVTLATAKEHLRITASDTTHDSDLTRKVNEASAIILNALGANANSVATIASSSVAANTVITTTAAHGFSAGQTVIIADHSLPDVNGSWPIATVPVVTSFTIAHAVAVAGTGGTATVLWTDVTVPDDVGDAVFLTVTHLFENRGEDLSLDEAFWAAIDRVLRRRKELAMA